MRFIYIGNCQTMQIKSVSDVITSHQSFRFNVKEFTEDSLREIPGGVKENDIVIYTNVGYLKKRIDSISQLSRVKLAAVPPISFAGGMPDCVYLKRENGNIQSPIGDYHSFIAYSSFMCGFNVEECVKLFSGTVYQRLGWFDFYEVDKSRLKHELKRCDVAGELVDAWCSEGKFMHTVNHPKIFVMEGLIKAIFDQLGVSYKNIPSSGLITDNLSSGPNFPSYIDYNHPGRTLSDNLFYKASDKRGGHVYSLEEFISKSYDIYRKLNDQDVSVQRIAERGIDFYKVIYEDYLSSIKTRPKSGDHPYRNKGDHCFWRKAVSNLEFSEVDPVVYSNIKVSKNDRVATAGSCFAQHIAKRLNSIGFNYYVAENASASSSENDPAKGGYGVFSCRYGNIYTARQLVQLFDEAFGERAPLVPVWRRPDGRYVDPFRPQIDESGFVCQEDVESERKKHLGFVREMFKQLDVFVFTLGLTECWEYIEDGSVLPIAPGVIAGEMNVEQYKFVNFSKDEVKGDLEAFLTKLKGVNSGAQVIFTVSPVPLMATYEERHVLLSTTLSKAALRLAVDEVVESYDDAHYFPSYEIITGNFSRGAYYESNLREVTPSGVDHVMRLFLKHFTSRAGEKMESDEGFVKAMSEADQINEIICDEEALDIE